MINWHEQWALHAHNFKDGHAHISLSEQNVIKLAPGGGFGDFSHPTTRLVLSMMTPFCKDKTVLDMGCGSGILALAAHALGAKKCFGVDICPEAVHHANLNASINGFDCTFSDTAQDVEACSVLLMNMIRSEQRNALQTVGRYFENAFTSGVLVEEKEQYLAEMSALGWQVQQINEEGGWLGFHFRVHV